MWNPEPYIERLTQLAPAAVRAGDPEGLHRYIHNITLGHGERRPLFIEEARSDLRRFRLGFVYDRQARLLIPCGWADHERTAAYLAQIRLFPWPVHWNKEDAITCDDRIRARCTERFLNEGWGFVVNSPVLTAKGDPSLGHRWPLRLGPEVRLAPEEKIWFKDFELIRRE
jgi:predicted pyridoxine 5'-phosphate oxidase superfamily flavin-nucleotide-binding protein